MKLQSMAILFAIIVIPITLILSAYIGIQIDTQSLWQSYDTKLLDATHDAVLAFQLNTLENDYSTNSDSLRRDVKASINTFFTSLATNLGTPASSAEYIMEYVPAVVVTLYDGYYIYSPIETEYEDKSGAIKTKYEHALKPYIQYTARYKEGTYDIVVNYSLDNYISVYGYMNGTYVSRSGYLIALSDVSDDGRTYKGVPITDEDAIKYYKEAKKFTNWIMNTSISGKKIVDVVIPKNAVKNDGITTYSEFSNNNVKILSISASNDPEISSSDFQAHKREIMRKSIQANLNNAIYVYNRHTTLSNDFRMPILTEQDWDKILTNVNIISFMQGMPVGTKVYNNYSIVTSKKNKQYVDKNDIYFVEKYHNTEKGEYHKIDCPKLKEASDHNANIVGYKSIDFEKRQAKNDRGEVIKDSNGQILYNYLREELACYTCIVNPLNGNEAEVTSEKLKRALYNAIGKERYNLNKTTKLLEKDNR